MIPHRREVIYDVTVLKPYIRLPRTLKGQMSDETYLTRALRYYFEYRIVYPNVRPSIDRHRKGLASSAALRLLHRVALKEDYTYRATVITLMNLYQEVERYVVWPRWELPDLEHYAQLKDSDEGIPNQLFRHYSSKLTRKTILGNERWFIHFDLMRDYYEDK